MRVLLTGANGFVGSHVLEALLQEGHQVRILIRATSDTSFIEPLLPDLDVRRGDLREAPSLRAVVEGAQAVIHCAALTAAVRRRDFYTVNAAGTRRLVEACNTAGGVERFLLVSSQAVSGPGTPERPAREEASPRPVSDYGRSKLLAERYVRRLCRAPWTILRPTAIYGPRDSDFLLLFRSARAGVLPLVNGGRQPLNVAYVRDVARAVAAALGAPAARGRIYHVAHPQVVTQAELGTAVANAVSTRPARLFVPHVLLYPLCLLKDAAALVSGRPSPLNTRRIPEYAAPGWVCTTERAADELGFTAEVGLQEGARRTAAWYRENGWLSGGPDRRP